MSLCINPRCPQPNHPDNQTQQFCQRCGAVLTLQGRYRVMRLLSDRSGFGYVYEAFEQNVPKILKVLKEIHNDNPKAVELFEQEARVLSQLQDPGIPFIDEAGCFQFHPTSSSPPLHCIVMEKIDGPNLREWMKQQGNHPINATLGLDWLIQLVEILHLVHQHSYFHRDIKPENIMLRSSGELVLVDFGAAREMTGTYFARLEEAEGVTRVSSTGYTPPEQERGRAVPQSDFYALGCTLMFLLTGQHPMEPNIYNALSNQFHWRQYAPHVPPALADLIDDLTAARAIDRPENTQVLRQRLAEIKAALPASASVPAGDSPGLSAATAPDIDVTEPPQMMPYGSRHTLLQSEEKTILQPKRRPSWLLALGAIGLCAVGLITARWFRPVPSAQSQIQAPYAEMTTLSGHSAKVNDLALSVDQSLLASASNDQTVKLWDLEQGQELRSLPSPGNRVQAVTFSPDGKLLISGGSGGVISVWDVTSQDLVNTFVGHRSAINDLKVSQNGQMLASAGADNAIYLWNMETGEVVDVLEGHYSFVNAIAFTPDGRTLVSGSADQTIRIWDLDTKASVALSGHEAYINSVDISPNGEILASAGADGDIVLWRLSEQTAMGRLTEHTGYVNALKFIPDGKTLITSSADQTIKVWDWQTQTLDYSIPWEDTFIDTLAVRLGNPYWQIMAGGQGSTDIRIWRID
ncbi:MAG: protein kinase [Elainellaceae cyanobacterium]